MPIHIIFEYFLTDPARVGAPDMKASFRILKERPRISVVVTCDPMSAADDNEQLCEESIEVYSFTDPAAFTRELLSRYLPVAHGSDYRWLCVLNGVRIAEATNTGIRALVPELVFLETNRVHFSYRAS